METIQKSIHINAPIEKVYEYLQVPTNFPQIWPSMVEVKDVQPLPNGGSKYSWVYKMAGMRFEGMTEDIEVVPNQRLSGKSQGGIESEITWDLLAEEGGTKVTVTAGYTVPIPLLGRLAEAAIVKLNENEGDVTLANLKSIMEK
jgi:uncharacterized membrane protein